MINNTVFLFLIQELSNSSSVICGALSKYQLKLLEGNVPNHRGLEKRIVALGPKMLDSQLAIIAHNYIQPSNKASNKSKSHNVKILGSSWIYPLQQAMKLINTTSNPHCSHSFFFSFLFFFFARRKK
jgi:hypothetical protein